MLMVKAFKEWKRLEYQLVLEGLKKYSATIERVANNSYYYDNSEDSSREYHYMF